MKGKRRGGQRRYGNKPKQEQNKLILPSPTMLESYEEIAPGSVQKIVDMAKLEQEHRHKWEHDYLSAMMRARRTGQLLGFMLAVIISYVIIVLAIDGNIFLAAIVSITGFGSLFGAMVLSRGKRAVHRPKR